MLPDKQGIQPMREILAYRSNTYQPRNFFTNRVIPLWNALPTELKNSRNVKIFKTGLEKITFKMCQEQCSGECCVPG